MGCDATFSDSRASQKDLEVILLFVQDRATDCQKSMRRDAQASFFFRGEDKFSGDYVSFARVDKAYNEVFYLLDDFLAGEGEDCGNMGEF